MTYHSATWACPIGSLASAIPFDVAQKQGNHPDERGGVGKLFYTARLSIPDSSLRTARTLTRTQTMTELDAVAIGREFYFHAVLLTLPALAVSLIVGLAVSIFQAVTNIQEQTLSFAPRIVALAGLFVVTMPWLLQMSIYFTVQMFSRAAQVGH